MSIAVFIVKLTYKLFTYIYTVLIVSSKLAIHLFLKNVIWSLPIVYF